MSSSILILKYLNIIKENCKFMNNCVSTIKCLRDIIQNKDIQPKEKNVSLNQDQYFMIRYNFNGYFQRNFVQFSLSMQKNLNKVKQNKSAVLEPIIHFGTDLTNLPAKHKIIKKEPKKGASTIRPKQKTRPEYEYIEDIYVYLNTKFISEISISDKLKVQQSTEVTVEKRSILMNWLINVHDTFELIPQTYFLAAFMVDKYCSIVPVRQQEFQLVGISALFTAAKYQQIQTPYLKKFIAVCDKLFSSAEILAIEGKILQKLDFRLLWVSPFWHLEHFINILGLSYFFKKYCMYVLELYTIQYIFSQKKMASIALAIISESRKLSLKPITNENIDDIMNDYGVKQEQFKESEKLIKAIIRKRNHPKYSSVIKKYEEFR